MFTEKNVINKDNFLKQTEDARLKRNLEKKRTTSAIKIQSLLKGYLARKRFAIELEYAVILFVCFTLKIINPYQLIL